MLRMIQPVNRSPGGNRCMVGRVGAVCDVLAPSSRSYKGEILRRQTIQKVRRFVPDNDECKGQQLS